MKLVNIEEAKKEFIRFAETYDLTNEHMNRKKYHSLRVTEVATELAKRENFTEEEIDIATIIGLLHDIARFKQYTEYQTFRDSKSIDHGNVGVELLEKDNYLRKYIETDQYDNIIKVAIRNHNKFAIEEGLTEEENKFCKLIRDADKIDIIYEAMEVFWEQEAEEMENSILNPEIVEVFKRQELLQTHKYEKIQYADKIIHLLGFIFDINYKSSFEIIKEKNYVDKIVNRFKYKDDYTQREIIDAGEQIKQFIDQKIQE